MAGNTGHGRPNGSKTLMDYLSTGNRKVVAALAMVGIVAGGGGLAIHNSIGGSNDKVTAQSDTHETNGAELKLSNRLKIAGTKLSYDAITGLLKFGSLTTTENGFVLSDKGQALKTERTTGRNASETVVSYDDATGTLNTNGAFVNTDEKIDYFNVTATIPSLAGGGVESPDEVRKAITNIDDVTAIFGNSQNGYGETVSFGKDENGFFVIQGDARDNSGSSDRVYADDPTAAGTFNTSIEQLLATAGWISQNSPKSA